MDENYQKALNGIRREAERQSGTLDLSALGLSELPSELWELRGLHALHLSDNHLESLPEEVGHFVELRLLDLGNNRVQSLPSELWKLTHLQELRLHNNLLLSVPSLLCGLVNLRLLSLVNNHLASLPSEVGQLESLEFLFIDSNTLSEISKEFGKLINLKYLFVDNNKLSKVPTELGKLVNLKYLSVRNNVLTEIPGELGNLTKLEHLSLDNNRLANLPAELALLNNIRSISYTGNPLGEMPPEILQQGHDTVMTYLQEQLQSRERQWVSKLLAVGEGGVGKTSVLRRLLGDDFDEQEDTTHGIAIRQLILDHPMQDVSMTLNAWDFGGQEIYHATHQFFLTNRSLFLLAWNARLGYDQGRVEYWLDTIQALAPESPVLLVATHIDKRDADLPLAELRRDYPQIVDYIEISSKTGEGIDSLKHSIRHQAAGLPLMGEIWPRHWLDAAEELRGLPDRHIAADKMWRMMSDCDVHGNSQRILATWLHELGDILFFSDDPELQDTVILRPQWVSEHVSHVLTDDEVIDGVGILTHTAMRRIWHDLGSTMRERFLRMMEKFDLSYRIPDDREDKSLVVERLSLDEADYHSLWDAILERPNCHELYMRYELNLTMPAGIPTWFIARAHRFTTHTHWRTGALFADDENHTHLALVKANRHDRYIEMTVRGPFPSNFFALLRDGLELTLNRFEGMKYQRYLPCPGHDGEICDGEFRLEVLDNALKAGREEIECQNAFLPVRIASILSGLDYQVNENAVLERLDHLEASNAERHREEMYELRELRAFAQREFAKQNVRAQRLEESHTPSVITLVPYEGRTWIPDFVRQKVVVQLCCEAPGQWHPTNVKVGDFSPPQDSGRYIVEVNAVWLKAVLPHLRRLATVLKFATPFWGGDEADKWTRAIELTGQLAGNVWDEFSVTTSSLEQMGEKTRYFNPERFEGAALRALRELLDQPAQKNKSPHWGGLRKVFTPEGHYLWLCEHHAKEYIPPPIRLSSD